MQITPVIRGESRRLLLIIRILASQNEPLWVPIIRKAKAHGFFHDRIRGISGIWTVAAEPAPVHAHAPDVPDPGQAVLHLSLNLLLGAWPSAPGTTSTRLRGA